MMKKTHLLLILLLSTFSFKASADHEYKVRKNCWGFISWRYKSYAAVKRVGFSWNKQTNNSCKSNVTSYREGFYPTGGISTLVPKAKAHAQAGPSISDLSWGWIESGWSGTFSVGSISDDAISEIAYAPLYIPGSVTVSEDDGHADTTTGTFSSISTGEIKYNETNHSITIPIRYGKIRVDDPDVINTYSTLKVFIYNAVDKTDENIENGDNGDLLYSMQAILINGELYLEGFEEGDFEYIDNSTYIIGDISKTIAIPNDINLNDILVRIGGDAGNLENGIPADYSMDFTIETLKSIKKLALETSKLQLNIYGNPVQSVLHFDLVNGTEEYSTVKIELYDIRGRLVNNIYTGNLNGILGVKQSLDISEMANGVYYLSVTTNTGERFLRKIVKK